MNDDDKAAECRFERAALHLWEECKNRHAWYNGSPRDSWRNGKKGGRKGDTTGAQVVSNEVAGTERLAKLTDEYVEAADALPDAERTRAMADLVVMIFQIRDARTKGIGSGAQLPSWHLYFQFASRCPATAIALLKEFTHYGRWGDLNKMLEILVLDANHEYVPAELSKQLRNRIIELYAEQLHSDYQLLKDWESLPDSQRPREPPIFSRAARWVPKHQKHTSKITHATRHIAERFYALEVPSLAVQYESMMADPSLGEQSKLQEYIRVKTLFRRAVVSLNAALALANVLCPVDPELAIDDEGNHERCLGRSLLRLVERAMAVDDNDAVRRRLVSQLQAFKQTFQSAVALDHEDSLGNALVIPDVSGSTIGLARNVAATMVLLISAAAPEPWSNKFLTFSSTPAFITLSGNAVDDIKTIINAPWTDSFDLAKAYDELLRTAMASSAASSTMPKRFIIITDRRSDGSIGAQEAIQKDVLRQRYRQGGESAIGEAYTPPDVVHWAVSQSLVRQTQLATSSGVSFASLVGFSYPFFAEIVEKASLQTALPPWFAYRKALDHPAYSRIREILATVREPPYFVNYAVPENCVMPKASDVESSS